MAENEQEVEKQALVTQKVIYDAQTHKEMKKIAIDLELDGDSKLTPAMYGEVVKFLLEEFRRSNE